MSLIGNIVKDTQYLKRIKKATNYTGHPRKKGIRVQAHHLISAKGVELSKMGPILEKRGYNINVLKNLVFLPSTLQGACHLGIQVHRGNHTTSTPTMYDDESAHSLNYHMLVQELLMKRKIQVEQICPGKSPMSAREVTKLMNEVSEEILRMIEKKPAKAPLTAMADFFVGGKSKKGCAGLDNIPRPPKGQKSTVLNPLDEKYKPCPKGRNHQGDGGITYKKGSYQLRVGR